MRFYMSIPPQIFRLPSDILWIARKPTLLPADHVRSATVSSNLRTRRVLRMQSRLWTRRTLADDKSTSKSPKNVTLRPRRKQLVIVARKVHGEAAVVDSVAEGAEDREAEEALRPIGCDNRAESRARGKTDPRRKERRHLLDQVDQGGAVAVLPARRFPMRKSKLFVVCGGSDAFLSGRSPRRPSLLPTCRSHWTMKALANCSLSAIFLL